MKMTKEDMAAQDADYADEFNQPDRAPREMSDEEAFGLSPEAGEAPAEESAETTAAEAAEAPTEPMGEPMGEPEAAAPVETAAAEAEQAAPEGAHEEPPGEPTVEAPSGDDREQRLRSWEGRLKARQAELDAREAAMSTSSVNEEQGEQPMGGADYDHDGDNDASMAGDTDADADPAQVLAEDFGSDFVQQLTRLIKQVAGSEVEGVNYKVQCVINDLQNERLQNHFASIAATHGDFMEVVESPEFAAWKAAQPDQARLQAVIDQGSARQIIDMLTAFKQSREAKPAEDDAIDAAEGVRSSSAISLPKEPVPDDEFAKAWNEA